MDPDENAKKKLCQYPAILTELAWSILSMYILLTKREVEIAGYWPSSLFFVFMDLDEVEVHKNPKREFDQYPAIFTELAWSVKDLLYGIQ